MVGKLKESCNHYVNIPFYYPFDICRGKKIVDRGYHSTNLGSKNQIDLMFRSRVLDVLKQLRNKKKFFFRF